MRKRQYDKKVRHTALCEGDRVLVRNMTKRGDPGKLQSYWEREICYNWLSARYCLPHAKILNTNTLSIILRCYVSPFMYIITTEHRIFNKLSRRTFSTHLKTYGCE